MLKSHLSFFWRKVKRSKGLFIANLSGLSMAAAFAMFAGSYLDYEWSYDSFYEHKDQVYRLVNEFYVEGEKRSTSLLVTPGLPVILKESIPGVKAYARYELRNSVLKGESNYVEATYCFAEPGFYEMFSFQTIAGDASALDEKPNSVFVSESFANKVFGDENPLGKTLSSTDEDTYEVSGVFADIPANSHLDFDIFISRKFNPKLDAFPSNYGGVSSYLWLDKTADLEEVESAMQRLLVSHGLWYNGEDTDTGGRVWLQSLNDIHLSSAGWSDADKLPGNKSTLYALLISAVVLVCVSWFNYLNLTLASIFRNRKGIAVRKIIGARRGELIRQYVVDALLMLILSLPLAVSVAQILGPLFDKYTGGVVGGSLLTFFASNFGWFSASLLLVLFACSLVSGSIIAVTALAGRPADLLKNLISRKSSFTKKNLQQSLMLIQLVAALTVSVTAYAIYSQVKFMETTDPGFNSQSTIVISEHYAPYRDVPTNGEVFKTAALQLPFVEEVTVSQTVPGGLKSFFVHRVYKEDETGEMQVTDFGVTGIDEDFTRYYDLELLAGSYFLDDSRDSTILINESASRAMGFASPGLAINRKFSFNEGGKFVTRTIAGVLKDYHQLSFKEALMPLVFSATSFYEEPLYSVRVNQADLSSSLIELKHVWDKLYPNRIFQFHILDDYIKNQYSSERTQARVSIIMSIGLVLISMLGLLGIVYFTTIRLSREISIRKVLGASSLRVGSTLTRPFVPTIMLAVLVAVPLARYLIDFWLADFAFRIKVSPELLAGPVILLLAAMGLALGVQFLKTLNIRVVDHLKDE